MAEKEYIEREAALKQNYFSESKTPDDNYHFNAEIKFCISSLPAADVAPVRHGEWQEINGIFRCSLCEYSFEHEGYQHFFNYCPNCGAKMDGGD